MIADPENQTNGFTLDAKPPFTFGIGLQGELVVGFYLQGIPAYVVIPASELKTLRNGLDQSKAIQETLSAKPPTQSTH